MNIISFGWTTPAIIAHRKRCTRRRWTEKHAAQFHKGDLVQAYNKGARNGGKCVEIIRLTADPYKEETLDLDDYEAEGFDYLTDQGIMIEGQLPLDMWNGWIMEGTSDLYVVRFEYPSDDEEPPYCVVIYQGDEILEHHHVATDAERCALEVGVTVSMNRGCVLKEGLNE